ncbi:SEC-C domain-containing protein [Microtetraspora sp. AC03309]|nr:SEC-C domain-containing protein [Microtetraspora sp. AC03309]
MLGARGARRTARPSGRAADAGEYAACRGDVSVADDYLRRSGQPTADALRKALRRQLAPPKSAIGRNQPCPCGSGRKYKVCCLSTAVHPLVDRAEAIYALLATYAQRPFAGEALGLLLTKSGQNLQSALLCVDLLLTDRDLTERFLRTRGDLLRDDERQLLESRQQIPIGLFEVREIRPNLGVTVRALPDGEPIFLKDRLLSASVRHLELLCGRILHDGTQPRVLSLPTRVPREERRELIGLLAGRQSAEQLAEFFAPRPEPYLRNGDGHDYCRHRGGLGGAARAYVLVTADRPAAARRAAHRALLAELRAAAAGADSVELVRRELDRAIFVPGFVDEDEVATYAAGIDRALELLAGLIDSGHATQAAELAQHARADARQCRLGQLRVRTGILRSGAAPRSLAEGRGGPSRAGRVAVRHRLGRQLRAVQQRDLRLRTGAR